MISRTRLSTSRRPSPAPSLARIAAGFAAVVLLACGGGGGDSAPPVAEAPPPPPAPAPPAPAPAPAPAPSAAPQWNAAVRMPTDVVGSDSQPMISAGATGVAAAVWQVTGGANRGIWGSIYQPDTGWGAPTLIYTELAQSSTDPRVVVDAGGTAVAVWRNRGLDDRLWSARYQAGAGGSMAWSAAVAVTSQVSAANGFALAPAATGGALLAWVDQQPAAGATPATRNLNAAEGDGQTWSAPVALEATDGDVSNPAIAATAGGAAVAWEQVGSTGGTQVFASRRIGVGTWTAPQQLTIAGASAGSGSFAPQVAVAANGKALVTWTQQAPDVSQLCSSLNAAGSTWAAGKPVTTPAFRRFYTPALAMNDAGQAVLAWSDYPTAPGTVFAQFYNATADAWSTAETRATTDTAFGFLSSVVIDTRGRATVAWLSSPGNRQLTTRTTDGGNTWLGEPRRVDSAVDGESVNPQIVIDGSGKVHATWLQVTAGVFKLWTATMK